MGPTTRIAAEDFLDALAPLDAHMKAMFGGYCVYVQGKVVALVCDGGVFVKRSSADAALDGWATLGAAYPGARETWRLPTNAALDDPERVVGIIERVVNALPARKVR